MAFPWAAVAQAVGQIGGGIWQNERNKAAQRREFRHNREMAEYAYGRDLDMWNRQSDWNLAMWNRQNEYNLPSNMMQRLRDAGLNPNLLASSGSAGGTAASIQGASSPKYQQVRANYSATPIPMPDVLGLYNAIRSTDAQVDNVRAQTELTKAKTLTEGVDRALKASTNVGKGYANTMAKEMAKYASTFARMDYMKRSKELQLQMANLAGTRARTDLTKTNQAYRSKELQQYQDYGIRSGDQVQYRILLNIMERLLGRGAGMQYFK